MKEALISPNEPITFDGNIIGERIAQVEPEGQTFPVGDPLYWMACDDNVIADQYYLANDGTIQLNPNYSNPIEVLNANLGITNVIPSNNI
jgi:hypothetical protein